MYGRTARVTQQAEHVHIEERASLSVGGFLDRAD